MYIKYVTLKIDNVKESFDFYYICMENMEIKMYGYLCWLFDMCWSGKGKKGEAKISL